MYDEWWENALILIYKSNLIYKFVQIKKKNMFHTMMSYHKVMEKSNRAETKKTTSKLLVMKTGRIIKSLLIIILRLRKQPQVTCYERLIE